MTNKCKVKGRAFYCNNLKVAGIGKTGRMWGIPSYFPAFKKKLISKGHKSNEIYW